MKIITYNVNGIRSALNKGFIDWLKAADGDIVCLQETKATLEQIPVFYFEEAGYNHFWFSGQKKGYSGVSILSKIKPDNVVKGIDIEKYDNEGRFIRADFGKISVVSVYHPSGSSGDERQGFKMNWLEDFYNYIQKLKVERPYLILAGDYNICHKPIDIHDPIRNAGSSGFLPEEREWMSRFLDSGFTDSFRFFNNQAHQYTWWSYRTNARSKNLGWRIDYIIISKKLEERLKSSTILSHALHSDHCPVLTEIDFNI
ncbi:MAG: exodeoxyribonuclease III [Bacteroidales bacterium]|nr:exodeoxyribonuclease III [Bacteroidales bacterium]